MNADRISRFKTVTCISCVSLFATDENAGKFSWYILFFYVEFITKYAICATVDPLVVPPADQSKLFRILQSLF